MPKYLNKSNRTIYLTRDNVLIQPNEIKITRAFYDDIPDLELIDTEPYVTPLIVSEIITLNPSETKQYDVFESSEILIKSIDQTIEVYLHELENNTDNVLVLLPEMSFTFKNRRRFLKTIFVKNPDTNSSPAKIYITLFSFQKDFF